MTIAREEIFGPVVSIIPYDTKEEAVHMSPSIATGFPAVHRLVE
jgi:acyl-CoA reductase-like NAD-dependent aldehyde dehydrogenase